MEWYAPITIRTAPTGAVRYPKKGGAGTACLKGTKARAPAPGK